VSHQITLDEETQRRAEARATELGISFADYVRRLLADDLGQHAGKEEANPNEKPDISIFFDLVTDGPLTNIARDKDKIIGGAVWEEHLRSLGRKPGARRRALKQD